MNKKSFAVNGCLIACIAIAVIWYDLIILFVDIRTWVGFIAGAIPSVLWIYKKINKINESTLKTYSLTTYLSGVLIAMVVNKLLNVGTFLLIVSSFVMLLAIPIFLFLYVEVNKN